MLAVEDPSVPPVHVEDVGFPEAAGEPRRCPLCLNWRPAEEFVRINSGIAWCGPCAVHYPELVPPPQGVIVPVYGALLGAIVATSVTTWLAGSPVLIAQTGLFGSVLGTAAGVLLWIAHSRYSALKG